MSEETDVVVKQADESGISTFNNETINDQID